MSLAEKEIDEKQKQKTLLRRHRDGAEVFPSDTYDIAMLTRQLKDSKSAKSAKGNKSVKKSSKSSKSTKSNKDTKEISPTSTSNLDSTRDCITVENFKSNGSPLENIIASMVEDQNFSFYCQEDFDVAKAWFVNPLNHPNDGKQNDEHYMKERFNLSLIHSANCKENCLLDDSFYSGEDWLSVVDHCTWKFVQCNPDLVITVLYLDRKGLTNEFTLFELDHLCDLRLGSNNLSGFFRVAY
ncbi:predicted protein [Chaetoceros tenuissimus]|uniref:Uncharacterized protein n=1 Tax=Chaetoceros tenuissimus TaxID=426638 RepID=A0AAD3H6U6_9STRA|nr:predicted protein [Chaetoceros tenuissimus]